MKKILLLGITSVFLLMIILVFAVFLFVNSKSKNVNQGNNSTKLTHEQSTLLKGISFSPKSFTATDINTFWDQAQNLGNTVSWAGDWESLNDPSSAAYSISKTAQNRSLTTVVIVGLQNSDLENLDQNKMDSLASSTVNFIKETKVHYLGLGNEVNRIWENSPSNYHKLVNLFGLTYNQVKKTYPQTQIFTVFQLERIKGLKGGLYGGKNNEINNNWNLLNAFPQADFFAFTTYPSLIYKTPSEIPNNYYTDVTTHSKKTIAFTEIGWPSSSTISGWKSSEQNQDLFLTKFNSLTKSLRPNLIIWPFLFDPKTNEPFSNMGLIDQNSKLKLAFVSWKQFK